jgi:hypothetical protein
MEMGQSHAEAAEQVIEEKRREEYLDLCFGLALSRIMNSNGGGKPWQTMRE